MSLNSNFAYANAYMTSLPKYLSHLKLNMQKIEAVIPNSPPSQKPDSPPVFPVSQHRIWQHRLSRTKSAILILPFSLPKYAHACVYMVHQVLSVLPPWHMVYPSFHSIAVALSKTPLKIL